MPLIGEKYSHRTIQLCYANKNVGIEAYVPPRSYILLQLQSILSLEQVGIIN